MVHLDGGVADGGNVTPSATHLDGCHFYIWVAEDGRLTFDERQGDDLYLHGANDCERCDELRRGSPRIHEQRNIYGLSDDPKDSLVQVLEAIADIPGSDGTPARDDL